MNLQISGFIEQSLVNGPGCRAVIWVQGCSLGCAGCFNPETHAFDGGTIADVDQLGKRLLSLQDSIEGITISGGEPLQQIDAVTYLVKKIKKSSSLSVLVFSGFSWEEINTMPKAADLLSHLDILIAGRYEEDKHIGARLIASSNKTVHFISERYSMADLSEIAPCEISIDEAGVISITGIDPVKL